MKTHILSAIFVSAIATLGCTSSLSAVVQVYTGPVKEVQTPGSALTDLHVARSTIDKATDSVQKSITRAQESTQKLQEQIQGADKVLGAISKESVAPAFEDYKKALGEYLDAVGKVPAADLKDPAKIMANDGARRAAEALRSSFSGELDVAGPPPAKIAKIALRSSFETSLYKASGVDRLSLSTVDALVCWTRKPAECAAALSSDQQQLIKEGKLKGQLAGLKTAVAAAALDKLTLPSSAEALKVLRDIKGRLDALDASLKEQTSPAARASLDASLKEAEAKLVVWVKAEGDPQAHRSDAMNAVAAARGALNAYARALGGLDTEGLNTDLASVRAYLAREDIKPLLLPGQAADVEEMKKILVSVSPIIQTASSRILATGRSIGEQGYDSSDPNLVAIAGNDDGWSKNTVDLTDGHAYGEGDMVIVQDSPTHFRVKQLRADPKGNMELAMSVTDVALEVATSVLLKTSGVDLGLSGGTTSTQATPDTTGRVADQCRAAVRDLSDSLRVELEGLKKEDASKPASRDAVSRARGLLAGRRAALVACANVLPTAGKPADPRPADTKPTDAK